MDYEVLSQRFVLLLLAFYHYSAVKVRGPFLRAGSILPPALFSVKGSQLREQKTPPKILLELSVLLPRIPALQLRVCVLSVLSICRYGAKSFGLNLHNYIA